MVVADAGLVAGRRAGRLDAPEEAPVGEGGERVVDRLARDGAELGVHGRVDVVGGAVVLSADADGGRTRLRAPPGAARHVHPVLAEHRLGALRRHVSNVAPSGPSPEVGSQSAAGDRRASVQSLGGRRGPVSCVLTQARSNRSHQRSIGGLDHGVAASRPRRLSRASCVAGRRVLALVGVSAASAISTAHDSSPVTASPSSSLPCTHGTGTSTASGSARRTTAQHLERDDLEIDRPIGARTRRRTRRQVPIAGQRRRAHHLDSRSSADELDVRAGRSARCS